ncbi:MAG: type III pantothenate kinase, partial [candidate division WOR-3 bacterium]|nr:type III pantothenate kinase [candidate division WOR-3 bacterium]
MLIAIDVGNSNIHLGEFTGKKLRLKKSFCFPHTEDGYREFYTQLARYSLNDALIISDARSNKALRKNEEFLHIAQRFCKFIILQSNKFWGLKIHYQPKQSLGTDRIIGAYCAYLDYRKDLVTVDFGTATTINLVTKKGEYLGGLILPGVASIINSYPTHLLKYTQSTRFISAPNPITTTTSQGIKIGLYYTIILPILEVIKNYEKMLKSK